MPLKYVPMGLIGNISDLFQIMAWRRTGDKSLSEPMMAEFTDTYMRHLASMSYRDIDHKSMEITPCITLTS